MLSLRQVMAVLIAFGAFSYGLWTVGEGPTGLNESEVAPVSSEDTSDQMDCWESPALAARYHLRKRTGRFFERSRSGQTETRQLPRLRTRRPASQPANSSLDASEDVELAARYHLRNRTKRFFQRTVG